MKQNCTCPLFSATIATQRDAYPMNVLIVEENPSLSGIIQSSMLVSRIDTIDTPNVGAILGHIQVNDTNRGAPGTGDDPFADIVGALRDVGWQQPIAVEPFVVRVDATATAAIGAATMRACWAAAA